MAIIGSLLDTDYYKLTMGQLAFLAHRDVEVRYGFTNRTRHVPLERWISAAELTAELDAIRALRFRTEELDWLATLQAGGQHVFRDSYLRFLEGLALPPYELRVEEGHFELAFPGRWCEAVYWETPALAVVNELYFGARLAAAPAAARDDALATGRARLATKIATLVEHPDVRFAEFGTRRRFSREWHEEVIATLARDVAPASLLGTSNVDLARRHGLEPIGTFAHETFMILSGVMHADDERIRGSHNRVLAEWWDLYGEGLSIALTDTYGSSFFFRDMTADQARRWRGLRQDSGDPFAFGEDAIRFYEGHGIDPRAKVVVFSDGLELPVILALTDRFRGRLGVAFGWGTNLTNDLGLEPLSLVVKAVEAEGHGTVKLSDNLAKATGSPSDIARFRRIFGHDVDAYEACTY